jgi:type II secretion system protein N
MQISPALLPLIQLKAGGSVSIQTHQGGRIKVHIAANQRSFSAKIQSKEFPLHSLLALTGGLPGEIQGNLTADGRISGTLQDPGTLNGSFDLSFNRLSLPAQNLVGMRIPELVASEGKLRTSIQNGRAEVQSLQIGKKGIPQDDIIATGTGHLQMAQAARASQLDLILTFELSEKVMGITPFLQTILQQGRIDSGEYRFQFKGSLAGPLLPTPVRQ